ncbi:MAG: protein kinase [Gammaproteobacteria bacterium]|nr:protein kinase [Gammaproteobacteria bacterium]
MFERIEDEDKTEAGDKTAVDHDTNEFMADIAAEAKTAAAESGTEDSGVDFDISSMSSDDSDSDSSADSSGSDSSSPSQQSWTPPGAAESPELSGLGPGSVIKERFILDEVLGSGGMGKVYKGRDLLKVEAKDRNPYVALKVLNEDFKEHPEAFIALQRESSRQQRLAHPNIATVYDFDRIGKSGTAVFITMELMEGLPLNTFIKKKVKPRGGLPFEEAFPIIRQLGAALAYAHKQNIVHSDFKPGNAFLCNDSTVKVLDFGIARAVKNPLAGEGAEKTLFDPSKLGALTPAYASLEMLEGEEPDTRDDIYALACVSYELLTGRHPFNKLPATSAKENNLLPAPVKSLSRRQMKGLMRGLAFERKNRSPDCDTFVEELEGKANWHKNPWVISAAVLLALGIGLIGPVTNYFHEQKMNELIAQVQTGQPGQIESVLDRFGELSSSDRSTITDEARDTIQNYFESQINKHVDPATETYDFNTAREYLARAEALYPDSASLRAIATRLEDTRDQRLYELNKLYIAALEQNRLIPSEDIENDIADVTEKIAEIDPNHPLLEDPRLFNAYGLAAGDELKLGNFEKSQEYINAGLALAPNDTGLINLQDRLDAAIEEQRRQERVADLQQQIATDMGEEIAAISDLEPLQDNIVELAQLSPGDALLDGIGEKAKPVIDARINAIQSEGTRADAEAFNDAYGDLLKALQFNRELVQVNLAHLEGSEREAAVADLVSADQARIQELLQAEELDQAWETEMQNNLQELAVLLPAGSQELQQTRQSVAELFTTRAQQLKEDERYNEALSLLERGERLVPESQSLADVKADVSAAEAEFLREREEAARQARIAGLKETLLIQAKAKDVNSARRTYDELRAELPADDEYLTETAPNALAEAYSKLAASRAEQGDANRAKELARAGLELQPDNQSLSRAMADYTVTANSEELDQIFANAIGFDVTDVSAKVQELREFAPDSYGELEQRYVQLIARRINTLQDSDPTSAMRLANNASRVFPGNTTLDNIQAELAPRPWEQGDEARAQLEAGRLSQANVTLAGALSTNPDHPEVVEFRDELEARINEADQRFEQYQAALRNNELEQAQTALARARETWTDNPEYNDAATDLQARVAAAEQRREQSRVLQREQDIATLGEEAAGEQAAEQREWQPITSDRICSERLAGYGRRARAICYDLVHERIRGPLMVVVPGDEQQSPFAIGKYEVSINDYNKYCYLSGNCKVEDAEDKNAPKTGLTLAEARAYTQWLSERTGKTYRLPTAQEWEYAANAAGEQPTKDFNCRVTLGDSVLKGTGPVSVTVGRQNGWGLKNYIGNVQEWVTNGSGVIARGGSYQDAHSKCDISLQHNHDGNADELTGFRLVLEDVAKTADLAER